MKTSIHRMGFVVMMVLGASLLGCAPAKGDTQQIPRQPERQTEKATAQTKESKITAPVQLTFTSAASAASAGAVELTLTVRALTDIPSGVARVILPPKIKLISGQSEVAFGALQKDTERQFALTVEAPAAGPFQIFAGVDCHITSGIQLHKEAKPLLIGQPPTSSPN